MLKFIKGIVNKVTKTEIVKEVKQKIDYSKYRGKRCHKEIKRYTWNKEGIVADWSTEYKKQTDYEFDNYTIKIFRDIRATLIEINKDDKNILAYVDQSEQYGGILGQHDFKSSSLEEVQEFYTKLRNYNLEIKKSKQNK